MKSILLISAANPTTCRNVAFTYPGITANICSDGSVQIRGTSWRIFNGSPSGTCDSWDFGTNASQADKNSVLYVCYPANMWNALAAVP
jgi:hypothetical protein